MSISLHENILQQGVKTPQPLSSGAVKALKLRQLFKCGTESEILHEVSPDHVDSFEKWCPAEST